LGGKESSCARAGVSSVELYEGFSVERVPIFSKSIRELLGNGNCHSLGLKVDCLSEAWSFVDPVFPLHSTM